MPKKLLTVFLLLATILLMNSCQTITNMVSNVSSSNIATVESMDVNGITKAGLFVHLKPTNAKPDVYYTVYLYEKGNDLHEGCGVKWNQPEINVKTLQTAYFPLSKDEITAYAAAYLQDRDWWKSVFSVKIDEPPLSSTPLSNISTQNNSAVTNKPSITVISPNGGENYRIGDTVTIKWASSNLPNICTICISYLQSNSVVGASFLTDNTGSYDWMITVPIKPTTHARIQIEAIANRATIATSTSANDFTISAN